jgi:hypothetical protein
MTPRENDKVCHWSNMTRVGTVKKVAATDTTSWYVGGSPGRTLKAEVQWPDGKVELVMLNELKVLERP